ncbi:MAG TPA: hypothetical protein IAA08_11120 [Candidatus Eubacterium avistercoris]|uniref:Uncharacterized protein n=1 Tax=Candidatus Eubacterium avistercoris TaxID=2838567 RepID=A0A9D2D4K3_9FIRM|nr:hypothetical protein [Candidatus Eubacterium avistercoris]
MNIEERKKLVARLLFASQQTAMEEAEQIKKQPQPTRDFLYKHLRNYVLAKYLLPKDCQEDHIKELAVLSLARTMKLDKDVIRNLDQATPCDHATSESTKKVLLLYAVQTDLGLKPAAEKLAKVETLTELTEYVYDSLKNKN